MKKRILRLVVLVVMVFAMAVPAFASTPATVNIQDVMGTAFNAAVVSIMESISTVLPIALPILGITIAIGFGIKFFKKITGKAN
jgi:hypothetical protein